MDPRLKAILQKAKQVDQAARKYDTVDHTVLEQRVNSKTNSSGLLDQVVGNTPSTSYKPVDVYSEDYKQKVTSSKLPPEIQKLMMENPIPQSSMIDSLTEDDIRDINPQAYSEEDEWDMQVRSKDVVTKKNRVVENIEMVKGPTQQGFDGHVIRKMIAEEIAKALPGIVENYFDKKMIQENVKILKTLNSKVKRVQ
jgi:hypothetical protein